VVGIDTLSTCDRLYILVVDLIDSIYSSRRWASADSINLYIKSIEHSFKTYRNFRSTWSTRCTKLWENSIYALLENSAYVSNVHRFSLFCVILNVCRMPIYHNRVRISRRTSILRRYVGSRSFEGLRVITDAGDGLSTLLMKLWRCSRYVKMVNG